MLQRIRDPKLTLIAIIGHQVHFHNRRDLRFAKSQPIAAVSWLAWLAPKLRFEIGQHLHRPRNRLQPD